VSKSIDEKILKACINKDPKAQEAFYQYFSSAMYGICLRYCSQVEDAQDVLQEGFLKVFEKLGQFEAKGKLEGWLRQIFTRTALEHYRSNKLHMNLTGIETIEEIGNEDFSMATIGQKEILQIMNKMALGYKTILNLYAVEGYSHAEIAELLGISEGTSKSQLARARQQFKSIWQSMQTYIHGNN
jgi:RNA polymerase sigma-70 factor (ECF subfamily)